VYEWTGRPGTSQAAVGGHGAGVDLPAPAVWISRNGSITRSHTGIPGRGVDNRDPPRRVEGGWWRFQRTPHQRGGTGEQTGAQLLDRRAQCLVVGLQVQPVPGRHLSSRVGFQPSSDPQECVAGGKSGPRFLGAADRSLWRVGAVTKVTPCNMGSSPGSRWERPRVWRARRR
jgi:hypothetical protein